MEKRNIEICDKVNKRGRMKSHIYKRIILNFDSQNAFDVTYTELNGEYRQNKQTVRQETYGQGE